MKVVLIEDLRGAGKKGDVVEVKNGYGRNFLIPRGMALPADESNVKKFENIVRERIAKRGRELKAAEDVKVRLEEMNLVIKKKAGLDGKLFGSVTHKDVAEALNKSLGIEIDKKGIRIEETIKNTGAYAIEVHLERGVSAKVNIEVDKEE